MSTRAARSRDGRKRNASGTVSERTKIDEDLRRSEERYRSVIEGAPWGLHFYELRDDGRLVLTGANPSADKILGIDHDGMIGKTIEEAFPGLVGTDIPDAYRQVARTGNPWQSERIDYSDNKIKGAFQVIAFRTAPGHMASSFSDISRRVRAEKRAQDLLNEVSAEKDRLSALLNSISDEVWFADTEKKFKLANPSALKAFALDSSSLDIEVEELAKRLEVFHADGSRRSAETAPPLRALNGETVMNEEELIRVPSTGQMRYRQVNATPVRDERGNIIGSVSVVRDITERKVTENALRSTSSYLEKLLAYANAPIIVWDTSFKITTFNRAFERMTGLSSGDVIGKDLSILFPPETKADSLELITRTLSGERWDSVEIPIRGSHGKTRLVLWNSANIYEQDGKTLTATIAQGQDITERKDAEKALKQYSDILERSNLELATAKGRLESLIASMPVGILISNLEGKAVATNQSLRDIWRGSVPLEDFEDFREYKAWWSDSGKQVAPEDWPIAMAIKEGKSVPECIFDIERFDGTDGTIICSAIPLRDPDGRTVAGAAFAQDISDLKRFEKAIVEEKNKLSFILDALPVAVSVTDASGKLVLVNSQVNVIWGGDMSRADNLSKLTAVGIDPKTGERLGPDEWPTSRVIRTGNPVGPTEIEIVALNGKKKTILASAVPMKDDSGMVTGAVAGSVDITPQKNVEQELAQSNAELQNFAYVASHDLREPLRTISGFLEILSMDYSNKLDDTAKDYISRAVNASGRLHNMIDDLLTFSRLETRKQPFRKVDLNEILKVTLTDLSKTIQDHRAKVKADVLPTTMVDEQQMTTVFRNLIDNAVKFHGSDPPKVTIKARRQQHAWEISVTDNGIGIDPAFQGKIFNMFTRLHTRKDYPGNGIGLATCKKIIERHGGHIWVESGSGRGSTFSFTLPDREPEPTHPQTIESWSGSERF